MKLANIYTDWRIVAGLALMMLGAGNWVVGMERTQQFSRMIAAPSNTGADEAYRSFEELDSRNGGAVLEPFTAEQRHVSYATVRMDFYHATFLTGQALLTAGLILTLAGFIGVIQRDARLTLRRLGAKSGGSRRAGLR